MAVQSARYIDAAGNLEAVIDGVTYQTVGATGPIVDQIEAWIAAGNAADPFVSPPAPPPPPPSFLAQDFMAELTSADYTTIQAAIAASAELGLLWASLLAQKTPISTASARFQAGWTALTAALGATRSAAIASALGIPTR